MNRRDFARGAVLSLCSARLAAASCANTTAEEVTAGLDLKGKTAVITGCNSGIGLETMRVLALRGAHVIGTARTLEKGQQACARIKGRATPVVLELSDFNSVVACADAIRKLHVSIDMLILNAGIVMPEWRAVNGIEQHFLVNHLGHFLLTQGLLDRVTAAEQGRVVVVGSGNHRDAPDGGIQFDDLSGKSWAAKATRTPSSRTDCSRWSCRSACAEREQHRTACRPARWTRTFDVISPTTIGRTN
jgi:NAD(P)-dependent dehydrogenase (short-subunit alcohol dehydrogenase family)